MLGLQVLRLEKNGDVDHPDCPLRDWPKESVEILTAIYYTCRTHKMPPQDALNFVHDVTHTFDLSIKQFPRREEMIEYLNNYPGDMEDVLLDLVNEELMDEAIQKTLKSLEILSPNKD